MTNKFTLAHISGLRFSLCVALEGQLFTYSQMGRLQTLRSGHLTGPLRISKSVFNRTELCSGARNDRSKPRRSCFALMGFPAWLRMKVPA